MRRLVVLGAGTAGTMIVNRLRPRLSRREWRITVVDAEPQHLYQPGLLLVPFGVYGPEQLVKPRRRFIPDGVELIEAEVELVDAERRQVQLADGSRLDYDALVIATGTSPRPEQTPGMIGPLWRRQIHEFYTLNGALALREALLGFEEGRLVVHIVDTPIKCPVAPLEFTFLVDAYLRRRGLREKIEITYVTPLPGAFTKPIASERLGGMLAERGIAVESDFLVERVDDERRTLVSYDEREIGFDLLVTVPLNMGADFIARSGLGDELNYVPVDRHTTQSRKFPEIFAIGDAGDFPTSKAGSTAHFCVDAFAENFPAWAEGRAMTAEFDGHANCFVESGDGNALLIDFDYDTEPLPGRYPIPGFGPFPLLQESPLNHWGKLAFRWIYWHMLLPGRRIPLPSRYSTAGKRAPERKS
ncbi:MAG TPA: FAD/NAD(P)-binding oxidoreductase [Actinospica sp.]|nr:FAD/NAD(P)-binding oxidoreductase [Actinospica sp.]